MPLNSRTFLTELKTFVISLAVLAFRLTLLLNCCRFVWGIYFLVGFPLAPSLELGANVSNFFCLCNSVSHCSPSCRHRWDPQEAVPPGSSMCASKSFLGHSETIQMVIADLLPFAIYDIPCDIR